MIRFKDYLTRIIIEGRVPNMFAGLDKPAPAPQLFHRDIGIPAALAGPNVGMTLRYGNHAIDAARQDRLSSSELPTKLPPSFTIIEVEAEKGKAVKWVVRFPLAARPGWDIVMAVTFDGFVKTVWLNHSTDKHATLKRHLYSTPDKFKRN